MNLKVPTKFTFDYPAKNIDYYDQDKRDKLMPIMLEAADGYCMYCGKQLTNETDFCYQVEHSVDKSGNIGQASKEETFLTHCKHNLSVACYRCNMSCKKSVEKIEFGTIQHKKKCAGIDCTKCYCSDYETLRMQYCNKNSIILQPQGYIYNDVECNIIYNLIYNLYAPDLEDSHSEPFIFINKHIRRFKLNGERFSWSVVDIASEIVNYYERGIKDKGELLKSVAEHRPTNRIGMIFLEHIATECSKMDVARLVEWCEAIVVSSAMI